MATHELLLRQRRYPFWYAAFCSVSDEKARMTQGLCALLDHLHESGVRLSPCLMDWASGNGVVLAAVAAHWRRIVKKPLHILACDRESSFVSQTRAALAEAQVTSFEVLRLDTLRETLDAEILGGQPIGMNLIAHLAYEADDIHQLVMLGMEHLGRMGVAVFAHNRPTEDLRALGLAANSDLMLRADPELQQAFADLGVPYVMREWTSCLDIPPDVREEMCDASALMAQPSQLSLARALAEFLVERPLESLREEGRLDAYVEALARWLNRSPGPLEMQGVFHIAALPDAEAEVLAALRGLQQNEASVS